MADDLFIPAHGDSVYVCMACGKTSPTRAPTKQSHPGWDESCMLNCQLFKRSQLVWSEGGNIVIHVNEDTPDV